MYLFFDDPDDLAIDALKDETRVTCVRCDDRHWETFTSRSRAELSLNTIQRSNTSMALQLARNAGYTWLAHIDSDELIYFPGNLKQRMAQIPSNIQVIKLTTLESVAEEKITTLDLSKFEYFKTHYPTRPYTVKHPGFLLDPSQFLQYYWHNFLYRQKIRLAKWMGIDQPFRYGYLKGHFTGKSIVRTDAAVEVLKEHYPVVAKGVLRMLLFSNLFVLHYDAPTYIAWKNKWVMRYEGSAKYNAEKEMHNSHLDRYYRFIEIYQQGNEEKLMEFYKELFLISPHDRKILLRLGLLRKINLDKSLFEPVKEE